MEENEVVPDHLRCHRTDGRKWQCTRRAMEDKKLCEIHYIQGRHRQHKQKVPLSLKLQRKPNRKRNHDSEPQNLEIRAKKRERILKAVNAVKKKRRTVDVSEALDGALKKMKLKRGDLQLELIREFLKRQVEKKKGIELERNSKEELMRELPNGLMAISPSPPEIIGNAGSLNVKLGLDSSPFPRRCFRSKNIEPLPIGSMQIVPYAGDVAKLRKCGRKKCHWCRKSSYRTLIKCSSCQKEFFCTNCIEQRYCDKKEFILACAVCCKTCSCRTCSRKQSKDVEHRDPSTNRKKVDKIHLLHYLIFKLLPTLERVNQDQKVEMEVEAQIKGKTPSEIHIPRVELSCNELHCCTNCKSSILDFHRNCTNCSYNLCLSCCWEFCQRNLPVNIEAYISKYRNRRKTFSIPSRTMKISTCRQNNGRNLLASPALFLNWEIRNDGSISCPPVAFGGCGTGILDLRCVFPFTWIEELEVTAKDIVCSYVFPESSDVSSCCTLCNFTDHDAGGIKFQQDVVTGKDSSDNFLYYPTMQDLHDEDLKHFQNHWYKGEPVIVRNVLQSASDLSWNPVAMFCTYLEKSSAKSKSDNKEGLKATNCLDWCEVEVSNKQVFMGSLEGQTHAHMQREMLKFKGWLSSHLFQEQFPAHYAAIIRSIPLQEYMNPESGLLNLAVKLPQNVPKPDVGPCIYISYGGPEDLMQADLLTNLHYNSNDMVNILAHATDVPVSPEQLHKIRDLVKKYRGQDHQEDTRSTANQRDRKKRKSSSHSENTGESSLQDITEGLQLPNGVATRYPDTYKDYVTSVDNGSLGHANEDDSQFDSETSIFGFRTIHSSEELDNQIFQDDTESCNCSRKNTQADSCGAKWDIFRREDVSKLLEYLRQNSYELSHSYCSPKHVIHPILDQSYFLDTAHKMRLKQEFHIEPWTFEQRIGEAVIIPAGCPYQIRKLKSCVNVVLDFISPENTAVCTNLIDELRLLPLHHKAKCKRFEVKKMALHSVNAAIKEIHNLKHSERTDNELME